MARINTYDLDTTPSLGDKWIGTDSETTTTKNFTVSSIINLINDNSLIDQFDGVSYEFKSISSENPNPTGVICVSSTNVLSTAFSAINNIFVSKTHATGDDVTAYLQAMDSDTIKIGQIGNLNAFGIFKVTNIQAYSSDSNFLQFTLTYRSGNGSLTPNEKYFISNYQATENIDFATKSVTELSDVSSAGSGSIITTSERGIVSNSLVHTDVVDNLTSTVTDVPLSAKQGKTLNDAIVSINTLLSSDEATLDSLQEIVDYIQLNRTDLDSLSISSISGLQASLNTKVDTVTGKALSANDFTDVLLTKLNNIAAGAEVNVQSNFTETNTSADSFILNKPTDLTDLSTHNVTELADISSAGSGYIITDAERTKLTNSDVNATSNVITDGTDSITVTPQSRTIEIAGTSNEVEVSPTGAQDLTADRSFTVGLPNDVTIGNDLTVTEDFSSKTIINKHFAATKTFAITVATKASTHRYYNSGSSLGYVVDGNPSPYITLTPGNTYKFDQSDSTNSNHPLHFFYNSDKSTPTGVASNKYTSGVTNNFSSNAPGTSGSYIQIIADENTPSVLHYMCDAHALMGNAVNFNTRNLTDFTINALLDVDTTGVANDKILKYNSSNGKFEVANESGGTVTETFKTISVTGTSGQSDVVADTATDTVTFNAGTGMSITTNSTNDTIEFASTATGGVDLNALSSDTIDVTSDSFGFIDSSDSNNSKKSTIQSLVSAIAGTDITATNGQLNVQASSSGVTPGTYGDANNTPQIIIDQQGRVTSATNVATAGSGGGGGAGSSSLSIQKNVFTATANQTAFTISSSITSSSNTQVYIDGVYQAKSNYTTSGSVITFSSGVPLGAEVEVIHFIAVSSKIHTDSFTGDGSDVTFDASKDITDENITQIYIDGVYQSKDNYTTSGSTITFSTAPPNSSAIEVVHFESIDYSSLASNQFTGTGSQTDFSLTQSVDVDTSFVFIQGVYQEKDQYSISGTTLTFTSAPPNGYSIEVVTVGKISVATNTLFTDTFTGNGSTSTYALGITPTDLNAVEVYLNGLYQNISTLSLSSQNLTFSTPPPSGVIIEVRSIGGLNASGTLAPATITGGTGISVVTNSANNFTISNTLIDVTVSFNAPTGQSLTYTTPASSIGQAGSIFPTTTFTVLDPAGGALSGTAVITGLPAGITSTQSYNNTNGGNILTITLSGVYPSANSVGTNLVISNLTVSTPPLAIEYLVVAGGSGGGHVGGGGAGGYRTNYGGTKLTLATATNYGITVGGGGNGSTSTVSPANATSGSNSVFSNITSAGGGYGGANTGNHTNGIAADGGSGGGGGWDGNAVQQAGGDGNTPSTTPSQGSNGGAGGTGHPYYAGGGGGGAGAVGQDAIVSGSAQGGAGGNGLSNSISGSAVVYAGGGGGQGMEWTGSPSGRTGGAGGTGGGGQGGGSTTPTNGGINLGGGGGSPGYLTNGIGAGGSGIVILRYPSGYIISGLSGTTTTVGTDSVTTFTSGTGNIQFN